MSEARGLIGATLGFFFGFAAVSLFGPTVSFLQTVAGLTPALAGLLISIPNLSGSILRIPFSALVDRDGGRKPFLILLSLSMVGVAGIFGVIQFSGDDLAAAYPILLGFGVLAGCGVATFSVGISQTSYWFPQSRQGAALGAYAGIGNLGPGAFALLLTTITIPLFDLAGSYLVWLVLLAAGTAAYAMLGRNAWYFQLRAQGVEPAVARKRAADEHGQELFPKARVIDTLKASAKTWQTWALAGLYFVTFGGFMALTGWLPKYWQSMHGVSLGVAGGLTALYSLGASAMRVAGGGFSDRMGGERVTIGALIVTSGGAVLVVVAWGLPQAITGIVLMAIGMGVGNAAIFKLVPQEVPHAIGGAAGWVGGIGAFGGFIIPNLLATFISGEDAGNRGYATGFLIFVGLAAIGIVLILFIRYRGSKRRRLAAG